MKSARNNSQDQQATIINKEEVYVAMVVSKQVTEAMSEGAKVALGGNLK